MYAIVESIEAGRVVAVYLRESEDEALAFGLSIAKEHGANKRDAKESLRREGFWEDENDYRVTVISVLDA